MKITTKDLKSEYPSFYAPYISILDEDEPLENVLKSSQDQFMNLFTSCSEEKLRYRYDEGKWNAKELIQHIADCERILSYRALCFARKESVELPAFDEDDYVANGNASQLNLSQLLDDATSVRKATINLYANFTEEALHFKGSASGGLTSVRALGFMISGHQLHHVKVFKERYL